VSDPTERTKEGKKFKPGRSIVSFSRKLINHKKTILGRRYLCRGCGMWIIAPSGLGKSTLSIQVAILWCLGKTAFGISSSEQRRILIIQAEDDEGDCIEMSLMVNHLGLEPEEIEIVEKNTEIIHCNDLNGKEFIDALAAKLQEARDAGKPFDIVIINPYGVYQGKDVQNPEDNTHFLNHLLNPVLSEFDVAAILIHHTPKTNFVDYDKLNPWDFQYAGAGSGNMTNWARAIMIVVPQKVEKLFMFVAAKRGQRIDGWNGETTRFFSHSDGNPMLWLEASETQKSEHKKAKENKGKKAPPPKSKEIFDKCISPVDWLHEVEILEKAQEFWPSISPRGLHDKLMTGVETGELEESVSPKTKTKKLPMFRKNGVH
jgi:AAA domain